MTSPFTDALHVGDLLGPLVDEHDHEVALGVVRGDRVGDRLQDHRLAGLRRRDDQAALALADRRDQVDDPGGQDAGLGLQAQPLLRVERRELVELGAVAAASSGSAPLTVSRRTSALNFSLCARPRAAG